MSIAADQRRAECLLVGQRIQWLEHHIAQLCEELEHQRERLRVLR